MSRSISPTPHASEEGLAVKSLEDVQEPVDFRLKTTSRPSAEQLDESIGRQLNDLVHEGHHHNADPEKQHPENSEPLYVTIFVILLRSVF